jgi:hypothetical protein
MNPEAFSFQLVTLSREPKLIQRNDVDLPDFHPPLPDTAPICSNIPRFLSSLIEVIEKLERDWVLKGFC